MPPCSMPPNNYKKTTNINSQGETKVQTQTNIIQTIKNGIGMITVYNIMNVFFNKNKVIQEDTCKLEQINLKNCLNNHNDCTKFMEALKQCQIKN
jgi:hypothetical protein